MPSAKKTLGAGSTYRHLNPTSKGHTMLIHLLTCLALTAITLTLFSRFVLDIDQTEEPTS
jgi:hypothetical protein